MDPGGRLRIGFLLNPIAGMGGAVALKGTDDVALARSRGAEPIAPRRAREFFAALDPRLVAVVSCPPPMGGAEARAWDAQAEVLPLRLPASPFETRAAHTREAAQRLREETRLLVFVGGDGTACDVAKAAGPDFPVLGVPSGVKMYSGLFAHTPAVAGHVVNRVARAGRLETERVDVLDIDEPAFRRGRLDVALCAVASVPREEGVQLGKSPSQAGEEELAALAAAVEEGFAPGTLLLVGGGTTTHALKRALGPGGSLLGVDAFRRGPRGWETLGLDCGEARLLELLEAHRGAARVVVSPLGSAGFVLGRGTAPLGPRVLRRVGVENVQVIATPSKARALEALYVDTGDAALDRAFPRHVRVTVGPGRERVLPVQRVER